MITTEGYFFLACYCIFTKKSAVADVRCPLNRFKTYV